MRARPGTERGEPYGVRPAAVRWGETLATPRVTCTGAGAVRVLGRRDPPPPPPHRRRWSCPSVGRRPPPSRPSPARPRRPPARRETAAAASCDELDAAAPRPVEPRQRRAARRSRRCRSRSTSSSSSARSDARDPDPRRRCRQELPPAAQPRRPSRAATRRCARRSIVDVVESVEPCELTTHERRASRRGDRRRRARAGLRLQTLPRREGRRDVAVGQTRPSPSSDDPAAPPSGATRRAPLVAREGGSGESEGSQNGRAF